MSRKPNQLVSPAAPPAPPPAEKLNLALLLGQFLIVAVDSRAIPFLGLAQPPSAASPAGDSAVRRGRWERNAFVNCR
jgi:hypothetical protein